MASVVSQAMTPKGVHIQIFKTCEYIKLHCKGWEFKLADGIKVAKSAEFQIGLFWIN